MLGVANNRYYSVCCLPKQTEQLDDPQRVMAELVRCLPTGVPSCNSTTESGSPTRERAMDLEAELVLQGLKCRTNKTLEFVAIDPVLYPYFLTNLNVELDSHQTKLVIVNQQVGISFSLVLLALLLFILCCVDCRNRKRSWCSKSFRLYLQVSWYLRKIVFSSCLIL